MTVDLSQFSEKYVKVTFSNGQSAVIPVEKTGDAEFPCKLLGDFYTADGRPKCGGLHWVTEAKAPSYSTHYSLQNGGDSSTFTEDLADFLCDGTLKDVQEFPGWDHLLKSRIREVLQRKLGNIREDLLEGMVQRIADKARW